ncbi:MAG: hypothetical protein R3C01_03855 [Planctomycetaceae bacterium]
MTQFCARLGLTAARFCLSAWIGAAVLFVVNGVRQVRHPAFDSTVKDHLALLRFPPYYLFGVTLLGMAACGLLAACLGQSRSRRTLLALGLVLFSGAVMAYDYQRVYSPIVEILQAEGASRPAEFVTLHNQSKQINCVHVGAALLAAILVCWEPRTRMPEDRELSSTPDVGR